MDKQIDKINDSLGGIVFLDEPHDYYVGDVLCATSVTSFIDDGFDFSSIPNIDYYIEMGNAMHGIMEDSANDIVDNGDIMFTEEALVFKKLINNAKTFFKKFKPISAEKDICIPGTNYEGFEDLHIGGKIDLLCSFGGKNTIVDYKTSSNIMLKHKQQVNLYRYILKWIYNVDIEYLFVVQINKDTGVLTPHNVEIIPEDEFIELFESWLENWNDKNEWVTTDE